MRLQIKQQSSSRKYSHLALFIFCSLMNILLIFVSLSFLLLDRCSLNNLDMTRDMMTMVRRSVTCLWEEEYGVGILSANVFF